MKILRYIEKEKVSQCNQLKLFIYIAIISILQKIEQTLHKTENIFKKNSALILLISLLNSQLC